MWRLYWLLALLNAGDVLATNAEWHTAGPSVEANPVVAGHSIVALAAGKIICFALLAGAILYGHRPRWLRPTLLGSSYLFMVLMLWHGIFIWEITQ